MPLWTLSRYSWKGSSMDHFHKKVLMVSHSPQMLTIPSVCHFLSCLTRWPIMSLTSFKQSTPCTWSWSTLYLWEGFFIPVDIEAGNSNPYLPTFSSIQWCFDYKNMFNLSLDFSSSLGNTSIVQISNQSTVSQIVLPMVWDNIHLSNVSF